MKTIEYLKLISLLALAGCAKFDFQVADLSSVTSFQVQTPIGGTALVPGSTFTMTGICDPLGGVVTITGSSLVEASVSGPCDPTLGTFSINGTAVPTGEMLNINATQTDSASVTQNSTINSIMIHCAGAPMRACALNGSGNPSDPYMVGNINCLQEMRTGLSCNYALNNNIDATPISSLPGGWEPVPNTADSTIGFRGRLDGRNFTISNLHVTPRFADGAGLFSRIFDEGNSVIDDQVVDLTFLNPSADQFVFNNVAPFGFVAGSSNGVGVRNITVTNADIDLTASGSREGYGFIIGSAVNSRVSDSIVSGSILLDGALDAVNSKYGAIGGIVGHLTGSQVSDTSSALSINSDTANVQYFSEIGGAFGYVSNSTVSRVRTSSNMVLRHIGTTSFSSRGLYRVAGFAGVTRDGSTFTDICVDSAIDFQSAVSTVTEVGGFVGRMSFGGATETNRRISVRGSMDLDPNGQIVDNLSGYTGTNFGPSVHEDIFLDSDIIVSSGITPFPNSSYGGLNGGDQLNLSYTNVLGISSHAVAPMINNPGGMFARINGYALSSVFYANDLALGGLPPEGDGPGTGVTSNSLAALGALPNGSYTGFDFVTVWERDIITNIPKLRFCP